MAKKVGSARKKVRAAASQKFQPITSTGTTSAGEVINYKLRLDLSDPGPYWSSIYAISAVRGNIGRASHKKNDENVVASIKARFICRNDIRSTFWQSMQAASQTTANLAFDVFDKHGCFREEFITGIWTRKMNGQCFIVIEEVTIHGSNTLDLHVLTEMFQRMVDHAPDFHNVTVAAFIRPSTAFQNCFNTTDAGTETEDAAEHFLKGLTYQQIGTTEWFGKPFQVPADIPDVEMMSVSRPENPEFVDLKKDLEIRRTQDVRAGKITDVSDSFRGHQDSVVNKLLQLQGVSSPFTPHQLAQAKFGCTCGSCLGGFISPRMYFTLIKLTTKFYEQLHRDMSCDGTRIKMSKQPTLLAKTLAGIVRLHIPAGARSMYLKSKDFSLGHSYVFEYIHKLLVMKKPPTITNLMQTMMHPAFDFRGPPCECCGKLDKPTAQFFVSIYFFNGGTLDACIDAIFANAEEKDEKAGDDTFWWPGSIVKEWDFKDEYLALKRCRNDSEFAFVKGMLMEG